MKLLVRILVPVGILGFAIMAVVWMMATRPAPQTRKPPVTVQAVEATRLNPVDYQVHVPSFGQVKPRTQSVLKPEVSGRVMSIASNFREGGFFEENDVLLKIDPRDYESALVVAEATLAQRKGALELELAQHEQAKENWRLLGDGSDPNPLTLREPQLAEAKANIESAKALVEEARRNLSRTEITAPYIGHVQAFSVDVGQYVRQGDSIGEIFAVDYVEIRMPVNNQFIDFLTLPESYRGDSPDEQPEGHEVILKGEYGSREVEWNGRLVRAVGQIDARSRELFVIAQVDDPYARREDNTPPLKVGQFVRAEILGEVLENVFVIPRSAVRDGNEILIIDEDSSIRRRPISIIVRDVDSVVVRDGLKEGEILCTTTMTFAADGAKVLATIDGVAPVPKGPPGGKPELGIPADGRARKPGIAKPADEKQKP